MMDHSQKKQSSQEHGSGCIDTPKQLPEYTVLELLSHSNPQIKRLAHVILKLLAEEKAKNTDIPYLTQCESAKGLQPNESSSS